MRIGKGRLACLLLAAWVMLTALHASSVLNAAAGAEAIAEYTYWTEIMSPLMSRVEGDCGRNEWLFLQAKSDWWHKRGPSRAYEMLVAWRDKLQATEEKNLGKIVDAAVFIGTCRLAIANLYSYAPFDRPWIRHRAIKSSVIFGVISGLSSLALFFLLEWHRKSYGLSKYKWQRTFWLILPGFWIVLFAIVDPDYYLWDPAFLVPGVLIPLLAYAVVWGTVDFALPWIRKGD